MINPFANPQSHFEISASNSAILAQPTVIYVGGAGDLRVRCAKNKTIVTYAAMEAGQWLPVACDMVLASGTTCSGIIGAYWG